MSRDDMQVEQPERVARKLNATAFGNRPKIKAAIMAQLTEHREADKIIHGTYWQDGKGCAVGCTLNAWKKVRGLSRIDHGRHDIYDMILGPGGQMLARLEDCIFEGLENGKAQAWPERFMGAISPGADLSRVGWKFQHWLLTNENVNPGVTHPLVRDAIKKCADLLVPLTQGRPVDVSAARSAARSAASAAWSAARSARSAARSAAESARSAAESVESAARSAASAAWSAAWSAESAAWSAASAESVESAARSAASAAYVLMSNKLVALLKAAK